MLALGQKEAADIVAAADHLIGIGLGQGVRLSLSVPRPMVRKREPFIGKARLPMRMNHRPFQYLRSRDNKEGPSRRMIAALSVFGADLPEARSVIYRTYGTEISHGCF